MGKEYNWRLALPATTARRARLAGSQAAPLALGRVSTRVLAAKVLGVWRREDRKSYSLITFRLSLPYYQTMKGQKAGGIQEVNVHDKRFI
jgi:hypothetical protein